MCDKTHNKFQLQLTFLAITSAKLFTSWEISNFWLLVFSTESVAREPIIFRYFFNDFNLKTLSTRDGNWSEYNILKEIPTLDYRSTMLNLFPDFDILTSSRNPERTSIDSIEELRHLLPNQRL